MLLAVSSSILPTTHSIALPEGEIEVLARNIFAENNNIQALVKGDKNAPYGRIIDAMGLLQGVTNKNVQLMTAPTE